MRLRLTRTQLCLAVAALTLVIGFGDYLHTGQQVPALPPLCPNSPASGSTSEACWQARNELVTAYADRKEELANGLEDRMNVYGAVIAVALLLAVLFSVPNDLTRRRRYFANVGTGGVTLLVGTGILAVALNNAPLSAVGLGLFFPPFALLAIGALGGIAVSSRSVAQAPAGAGTVEAGTDGALPTGRAQPADPRLRKLVNSLPLIAIGLGVLTVLFLNAWSEGQPACYSETPETASAHTMNVLGTISYIGTLGAGVGLLINRRWFFALAAILITTFIAFFIALGVALHCD